MFLLKKYLAVKGQLTDRIWLYKNGDECVSVTGGWAINGASILKNATNIQLNNASASTRRISTFNNITITNKDRLFVKLTTTGSAVNYSFGFGTGTTISRFVNLIKGNLNLPQSSFTPNVETIVEFLGKNSTDIISLVNNFGVWNITEIWIDKYDY